MNDKKIAIGDQVRVQMARELEGKVHRVGEHSATVLVENEHGVLVISAPLTAISRLSISAPIGTVTDFQNIN